jgi:cation transport protein ChaC
MSLTPELIARIHRDEPKLKPPPGTTAMTETDYEAVVDRLLARHDPEGDLWVFVYGSLLWRPASPHDGQRRARLSGWHRSFCFRVLRHRGTPDRPGLMLALDRGGACVGMVQRHGGDARERLGLLVRREMSIRESANRPRWVTVEDEDGNRRRAVAFAADRSSPLYCGRQTQEATVAALAASIGHVGSCAEYLMLTVRHLEELGIHDPYLWRLQELVAARIVRETEKETKSR